jgi:hypothetical protein
MARREQQTTPSAISFIEKSSLTSKKIHSEESQNREGQKKRRKMSLSIRSAEKANR